MRALDPSGGRGGEVWPSAGWMMYISKHMMVAGRELTKGEDEGRGCKLKGKSWIKGLGCLMHPCMDGFILIGMSLFNRVRLADHQINDW
jgi:hypothetical protein